jgi:hypothetical protein
VSDAVAVAVVVSVEVVSSCLIKANDFILLLIYLELTTLTTREIPKRIYSFILKMFF